MTLTDWAKVVNENWQLFAVAFAAITGAIGYLIRHRIERKKELVSKLTEEQRAIYQDFARIMVGITQAPQNTTEGQKITAHLLKEFQEMYKKLLVHASPRVIRRVGDFMQYVYQKTDASAKIEAHELLTLIAAVIGAMRSDLGLRNWKLGYRSWRLFRAQYRDMDKIMAQNPWHRRF